jgi:1,2-diacylglycerol 3-alpha-glucosyltransferase
MKVLISTDCYTYQTGGITNVVLSLERSLRDLGHEVKVLALSNSGRSYKEGESYYIRSIPFVFYPEQRRSMTRRDPLLDELKAWKPDIVHIHTEASTARMARAIAREAGAPIVMTTHTDFAYFIFGRFRDAPILKKLFALWGKRAYRCAQAVVVPSEKARSFPQLVSAADRLTVIPNGIQLERYQRPVSSEERAALFRRYRLADNGCTLVMVTRLSREKNIAEILRYFPALLRVSPKAQLIIAGDGPERKRLEMMAERNGLAGRVRFTGRIDPDEVYRYYALGDVFVSASTFEVHSMSYLEAMACGLPLVCREDASLRGMLDDGENGIIYRTEAEFTEAVARVLGDKPLREAMRAKALVKAGEYSDRRFARCTLDLYEKTSMGKNTEETGTAAP